MRTLLLSAALAAAAAFAAAQPVDRALVEKLRKESFEAELTIERFKRLIPPGFDLAARRKMIDNLALKAELSPIDVKVLETERPLAADDGTILPLTISRVEIAGRDAYGDLHFFLSMLLRASPLAGLESLRMDAGKNDDVQFLVRLSYLSWAPIVSEKTEVTRDVVAAVRRDLQRNRAILNGITAAVGRVQKNGPVVDAVAGITKAIEEQAVALTSVSIDDDLHVDGVLMGAEARRVLSDSVKASKVAAREVKWAAAGSCQSFSVVARREAADDALEALAESPYTVGASVFDAGSAGWCRDEPAAPTRTILARGASAKDPNAFYVRLRNVDLVDVFFVLNELPVGNFVVEDDVKGRVDLDIHEEATLSEVLTALSGEGLIIGAGPLRRVSRGKGAVSSATPPEAGGQPINISIRHATVADILCLLGEVTSREVQMPREAQRRISIFASELGAEDALAALLPKSVAKTVKACELAQAAGPASGSRLARMQLKLEQLAIADVRIAGLVHAGDAWRAYVMVPTRRLMVVEAGQRFRDGTVKSIGKKGITFASEVEGLFEVAFVP